MKNNKILVVAMSPPPYGGQALMVQTLVNANLNSVQLYHIRMGFSDSMGSVGRFELKKIIHMFSIVWKAIRTRYKYDINTLYYVPGGSSAVPIIRDIFILFFLRKVFGKVIFHFHAAGISQVVENLPVGVRHAAKSVYNFSNLSIFLSYRNPDHRYFKTKKLIVVPNGLEDAAQAYLPIIRQKKDSISILFVGVLLKTKGVRVLLEAIQLLVLKGYEVKVNFVGEFASMEFKTEVYSFIKDHELSDLVHFHGVLVGDHKWKHFAAADVFCFPSFFESESFGNVIVEAMMFELPVIATHWRGIPDIVDDDKTGLLIPVENAGALAIALKLLIHDFDLRRSLGKNGRLKYLSMYQLQSFISNLDKAFEEVIQ